MRFNYRPARPAELADCFTRFGETFAYPAELRARIPALWRRWVDSGQMMTQLVEDNADLGRPEPVAFGAAVFIAEPFAAQLRGDPPPFARAELVRRAIAGEPVVLEPEQVRAVNRGPGLSLFFVNDALTNRTLDDATLHLVHERWSEALYELRAFRLRELFWELYSAKIQRWSEGCGLHVRRAWTAVSRSAPRRADTPARSLPRASAGTALVAEPPAAPAVVVWPEPAGGEAVDPDRQLFLVGLNGDEVKRNPGTHGSYLFAYTPPRFDFTCRQQELLKQALEGNTDTALAATLGLSLPAVKKRWIAIYDQVSAKAPGWLESGDDAAPGEGRGAEKRRRLLHYLRQHPEELHPANARGD